MRATVSLGALLASMLPAIAANEIIDGGTTVTVPSPAQSSPWDITGSLTVGDTGTGTLNIEDGGNVTSANGYLGAQTGSSGTVVVNGADASWIAPGELGIGQGGQGTFTVSAGAEASFTYSYVGVLADSHGTATVTGTDSIWTATSTLYVGYAGTGIVTVEAGGALTGSTGIVGAGSDSAGTVTVTGANSTWTATTELGIGQSGTGTLNVMAGGQVSTSIGYIGVNAGSLGTATVTGMSSTWTNTAELHVGYGGTGTLAVEDAGHVSTVIAYVSSNSGSTGTLTLKSGSTASSSYAYIGVNTGSNGSVTVTDANSLWTNSNDFVVGGSGVGEMTVSAGGAVSSGNGYLGLNALSTGTATVTGTDSSWSTDSSSLFIGLSGTGTLNIEAGGTVTSGESFIGYNSGSTGTATVTGESSTWDLGAHSLSVGHSGTGTLNIEDGGKVTTAQGYLGVQSDSSGTANVTGENSVWDLGSSALSVGYGGEGTLNIEDGGSVKSGEGVLGQNADSTGTATVTGEGSTWDLGANALYVGFSGGGTLAVEAGGKVTSGDSFIGYNAGVTSTATVTGEDSTWDLGSHSLSVGFSGTGTLDIEEGGKVTSGYSNIAVGTDSTGTVTVTGVGSTWNLGGGILGVGYEGNGTLNIEDGGTVESGAGVIGYNAGSSGTATVTGAESLWNTGSEYLYIGQFGSGTLTIEDGGEVSSAKTFIGNEANSSGTLNLDGDADGRGVLATGKVVKGAGTATLNFNGGVLKATDDEVDFLSGFATGDIQIETGGAFIDTNGHDVEADATLQGVGALTKMGDGTLTLTGTSSYSGSTIVEAGTLAIADGGSVTSGSGFIGNSLGSAGAVTVTGESSNWNLGFRSLTVGNSGTGTLVISDGGSVDSRHGYVGFESDATGTATVTGMDAAWNINGSLYVGYDGTGTVTIEDGGVVVTKGLTYIGNGVGSSGTLNLDGTTDGRGVLETSQVVAELGTATLNFDGGVLRATDDQANLLSGFTAGDIQIMAGGAFVDTNGYDVGIDIALQGEGGLTKQGEGTLTLWAVNSYAGATIIDAGTLVLSGSGSIAASSGVTVNGTLDISGTAGTTVANLSGTDATGTVALGSQTLIVKETNGTTFAGTLAGSGSLIKEDLGTLTLTGDSSMFDGSTQVLAGVLSVSSDNGTSAGVLGGAVSVLSGGTLQVEGGTLTGLVTLENGGLLGGNGTIGGLEVKAGGVVAPGNSPGTLAVNGAVTFSDGATYRVDTAADGQHDLIAATGAITISGGASVEVLASPGAYDWHTTYTILSTEATVDGTFGSVTSDYAFLIPLLTYDAQNVYLTLANSDVPFASFAQTPNQAGVAVATQALGLGNEVYDAILGLPERAVAGAFNALSGEVYASAATIIQQQSTYVREAVGARQRQSVTAPAAGPLAYAATAPATATLGVDYAPTLWAQGYGGWGDTSGNSDVASVSNTIGGFLMGADVAVADNARAGLFGGYSRSTFDVDARSSSGDMDNYDLGLYAGARFDALAVSGGLAYSWHDATVDRMAAFPGFAEALNGDYSNGSLQVFGELGYSMAFGAVEMEPFVGAAYLNIDGARFNETGGAAALAVSTNSMETTYTTLGLRVATTVEVQGHGLTPNLTLGWQHAFGDTTPVATMMFGAGDLPFQVGGVPIAEDSMLLQAGIGYTLSDMAVLSASYSGQYASSASQSAFTAQFALKF